VVAAARSPLLLCASSSGLSFRALPQRSCRQLDCRVEKATIRALGHDGALCGKLGGMPGDVARTWGSTADERAQAFPCDALLTEPDDVYFRALDVDAPAHCVVVEDTPSGVTAAVSAQMHVGYAADSDEQALRGAGATEILHTLDQLLRQCSRQTFGAQHFGEHAIGDHLAVDQHAVTVEITSCESRSVALPDCGIWWTGDPQVRQEDLKAWAELTAGAFAFGMLPGGHFFIDHNRQALLDALDASLNLWH
jgi:hypothetical protein